jgi:hypothetical protein
LLVSGVLNIAYFWPVVYQAYFQSEETHDAKPLVEFPLGGTVRSTLVRSDGGRDDGPVAEDAEVADDAGGDEAAGNEDGETDGPAGGEIDPEVVRPDFSGESVERDYGESAPLVDGEYAVDRNPSDHVADADDGSTGADHEHEHDHHGGGPPPGGWERRGWLGQESTWFMLGPILAAMVGSVVLGLVPYEAVFLRLIVDIVAAVLEGVI